MGTEEMSKALNQSAAMCGFFQDIHEQCKIHRETLGRRPDATTCAPLDLLLVQVESMWDAAYANYNRHKNDAEPA
jgi:hypothetical protein